MILVGLIILLLSILCLAGKVIYGIGYRDGLNDAFRVYPYDIKKKQNYRSPPASGNLW